MKKLLLLTLTSLIGLTSYGVSLFSENFDAWAPEADGTDVLSATGQGWYFYKQGYTNQEDRSGGSNWNHYPAAGSETTRNYSVTGPTAAFNDAVSGRALLWTVDYEEPMWDAANNGTIFRHVFEKTVVSSLDASNATGDLTVSFDMKSLAGQYGISQSDNANTLAGAYIQIGGPDGSVWDTQTHTLSQGSSESEWTSITQTYVLDGSQTGMFIKLGLFTEANQYSANGIVFDNINVSAVPEPSTYALLAGFAAFLFVAIRRRK